MGYLKPIADYIIRFHPPWIDTQTNFILAAIEKFRNIICVVYFDPKYLGGILLRIDIFRSSQAPPILSQQ